MKLLILGLIVILLVLLKIYFINKEGFDIFNDDNKNNLIKQESKLNNTQARNYGILASDRGPQRIKDGTEFVEPVERPDELLELDVVPEKNQIKSTKDDNDVKLCSVMQSCPELTGSKCGYCAETKEFSYATIDGKNSATGLTCSPNKWTTDAKQCAILRDKQVCEAVKSCGDLYGDAEKLCGFCPTTQKSYPMKKVNGKMVTKYDDDVCPATGRFDGRLLGRDECGAFLTEHPCITPYFNSGPHTKECLNQLWNNSCKPDGLKFIAKKFNNTEDVDAHLEKEGKRYGPDGVYGSKSYGQIGSEVQVIEQQTRSNDYLTAKGFSEMCYGESKLDPCNIKYAKNGIPHPECLKQKYFESGCNKEGTGFKALNSKNSSLIASHIKDVNTYNTDQFKRDPTTGNIAYTKGSSTISVDNYVKNLTSLESLTVGAEDYKTRKITSKICYGKEPPPPPPIKKGDTVSRNLLGKKYEGIATDVGIIGGVKKAKVMWYQYSGFDGEGVVKRKSQSDDEKRLFGWPGVAPLGNRTLVDSDGWINTNKLKLVNSCSDNTSSCKLTCVDTIRDIELKFPLPLDCVQSNWSKWSNCSKSCGGGIQSRTRKTIYPAQFGGKSCGPLKQQKSCNRQPCLDKRFKKAEIPTLKNKRVNPPFPTRENFKLIEGARGSRGNTNRKLGRCEGDCDGKTSQCLPGLACFQRNKYTKIPGCKGRGKYDWDYCVPKALIEKPKPKKPKEFERHGRRGGGWRETGYRGKLAITRSGRRCQKWTDAGYPNSGGHTIPRKCITAKGASRSRPCRAYVSRWNWCGGSSLHRRTAVADCTRWWRMANRKGLGQHNYCRNPNNHPRGIWCYTTDRRKKTEFC